MANPKRFHPLWIWGVLIAGLVAIYSRLVIRDPMLEWDDLQHLQVLLPLHSVGQYFQAMMEGRIGDFQPIRELSYVFDIKLSTALGFGTFHLTNLLLWIGILWVVHRCLMLLHRMSASAAAVFCGLYGIHPVFVGAVGWMGARKHLLSAFFSLCCLWITLRKGSKRELVWAPVFYGLAVLSHPAPLLMPLWLAAFLYFNGGLRSKEIRRALGVCVVMMALVAGWNYYYYAFGPYLIFSPVKKIQSFDPARGLLAIGRYFLSLFFPFQLAVTYLPGFVSNTIGLLLLPFACLAGVSSIGKKKFLIWFSFFLFPLVPTTVFGTNIFADDAYLVLSAFGVLNLLVLVYQHSLKSMRWFRSARFYLLTAIATLLLALSILQSRVWLSDTALWAQAAERFPYPQTVSRLAHYELLAGESVPALLDAIHLREINPEDSTLPELLIASIRLNPELPIQEKIDLLEAYRTAHPSFDLELARIYYATGKMRLAYDYYRRGLVMMPSGLASEFDAAAAVDACLKAGRPDCLIIQERILDFLKKDPAMKRALFLDDFMRLTVHPEGGECAEERK